MLSTEHYVLDQLIDNAIARLKRLGNARADALREIQRIDVQIRETSEHLLEAQNQQYLHHSFNLFRKQHDHTS